MIYVLTAIYNRRDTTLKFIEKIYSQTMQDFEIVVVDDASTDGSVEAIKKHFPKVKILSTKGDVFWTRTMAMGVEYIKKEAQPEDFILFANNDHFPEKDALEICYQTSLKYNRAVVAAAIKNSTGKIISGGHVAKWKTRTYPLIPIQENGVYDGQIDVMTGRFTLLPIEVFSKVAFDYKRFPHYLSDYDFFLQVKRAGFKMVVSYDAVSHDTGIKSGIESRIKNPTLKQAFDDAFHIKSHSNMIYMIKYLLKNCPNQYYKIKHIVLLIGFHAIKITKVAILSPFKLVR
ncbi:MAG: glycosyltransferase family 2 protein [bacterium]|nr:glycosyltransferase family 2 protein [bacterium]